MSETTNEPIDPIDALAAAVEQSKQVDDPPQQEVPPKEDDSPKVDTTVQSVENTTSLQITEPEPQIDPGVQADLDLVQYLTSTYIHDPLEEKPYTKAVLYGEMGGGKTKAASESPGPLLIAIERGQSTLFNHPDILRNGIKVMKFATVRQIEDTVDLIKKGYFEQYETIILDTFSELQYTALDNRVQQKWAQDTLNRDPYTPEGKDYQGNTGHMRRIAAAFRDIDRNVIFVCHSVDKELKNKSIVRRPSTSPMVTEALNQYVDVVAYMWSEVDPESGEEKFYAITRNTQTNEARITAKTRIKSLDTLEQDLTFNRIHTAKLAQIEEIKRELGRVQ